MKARYLVCLGLAVKRHREAAALTQAQVARAIGISRGSLASIETGIQNPTILGLASIAEAIGTSASVLLTEAEREEQAAWNAA